MLAKRIIPCLDVKNGMVTKGVRFENNAVVGDMVELAKEYERQGADELVFYDIGASPDASGIQKKWISEVAASISIPFCVGGGIKSVDDMRSVLLAGAEKISVNSAAITNPVLIASGKAALGSQCIVLGVDVKRTMDSVRYPSGFRVFSHGGRVGMELDAISWIQQAVALGAGEICLNSIDADGTRDGYDLELVDVVSRSVSVPVIASGGAGSKEDVLAVFQKTGADATLVASILHFGQTTISEIKGYLKNSKILVRS